MADGRSRAETFGSHLQRFAGSVDNVDDQILHETRDLVYRYVRDELNAAYFELARAQTIDQTAGLTTDWSSTDRTTSTTIKGLDGRYHSHLAVSFDTGRPLWIVSPQRQPLRRAESYVDLWSGVVGLPAYKAPLDRDLFTSIVVPIRRSDNRILGVMCLELASYVETSEFAREELVLLTDSLGLLMDLHDLNRAQAQGTRDAIMDLRQILETLPFPQVARPQIFVAYSSKADREVVSVVIDVLDEFSGRVRIVQWRRIADTGAITAQLAEAITTSRFGLCYLSEPYGDSGYRDNPNVVFEAGMLHAVTVSSVYQRSGWIPLREVDSPPLPFDFANERIVLIPRRGDGRLNKEQLRATLRARIGRLTDE